LIAICFSACGKESTAANSVAPALPAFLPAYYAPMLKINNSWLAADGHKNENGTDQYDYKSADQMVTILVGNVPCAASICETVFNNFLKSANEQATKNSGEFIVVTPTEYRVKWKDPLGDNVWLLFGCRIRF
jgi:hypothetical protein